MTEQSSLQFYLGAEDIDRIVNAFLPALEKYLSKKTKDEQYVYLTTLVNLYSKDKTYGNKTELNKLVKDIGNKVGTVAIADATKRCGDLNVVSGQLCTYYDDQGSLVCNSHGQFNTAFYSYAVPCAWIDGLCGPVAIQPPIPC